MPVEKLLVDGKQYLYFYCYDAAARQKKRVYIGPASGAGSRRKARIIEGRYRSVRRVEKRVLLRFGKLTICCALGDSAAAAIERLAIAEELENTVCGGHPLTAS